MTPFLEQGRVMRIRQDEAIRKAQALAFAHRSAWRRREQLAPFLEQAVMRIHEREVALRLIRSRSLEEPQHIRALIRHDAALIGLSFSHALTLYREGRLPNCSVGTMLQFLIPLLEDSP